MKPIPISVGNQMNKKEKIIIFKLTSGEEIVGKFVEATDIIIRVRSPLRVERLVNGPAMYYTLRAWLIQQFEEYEEKVVAIQKDMVMAQFKPGKNVIDQYHNTLEYMLSPSENSHEEDSAFDTQWLDMMPGTGKLN